ncbi:MAG: DUF5054 domain-containing protein [Lachnospiraceae bacterium]|nr:DUF5054 domain-containing protein [Lachnospiraceae bacterium]
MIRKVILVFKTHFDIGFTDRPGNVMHWYATDMLDSVLATCRATEDWGDLHYVWTLPAWPLKSILENCGSRKEELEHFIQNGQIAWHALAFTSHTDFCGEEEYLESLRYAKELSDTYGRLYPKTAKMTDVPGHGLMLPEVLSAGGVEFLHLGCNEFAMPPDVPGLFWWEAPSGRRVLTMYHKGGYGSGLQAPESWPFPVWMAMMPTMDNSGPDKPERVQKLKTEAEKLYPGAEIMCGTMDDFWNELKKQDLSGLPVVCRDLADTWIHGVQSYPKEVRQVRQLRREARALDLALAAKEPALLRSFGDAESDYYENMHLFGEHTWGADVKTWLDPAGRVYGREQFEKMRAGSERYAFMEKSWNDKRAYAQKAGKALEALRTAVPMANVPETRTDRPLSVRENEKSFTVSGGGWCLTFDKSRGVIGKVCREDGKALLQERNGRSVFDYQYTRWGTQRMTDFLRHYAYRFSDWGIFDYGRRNYPECGTKVYHVRYDKWAVNGRDLVLAGGFSGGESFTEFGNAKSVRLTVRFPEEAGALYVTLWLDDKPASPFIESGALLMPLAGEDLRFFINKNGVMIDPKTDIARNANHCFYAMENGLAASSKDGARLCIAAPDTPLLSIGQDAVYDFQSEYQKTDPTLYFNLFNNMWGTNFPQWIEGSFEYRFAVQPLPGNAPEELLARCQQLTDECAGMADAARYISDCAAGGRLPDFGPDMQLLGIHPQGEEYRISVRNLSGRSGRQTASWTGYELQECDYFGRKRGLGNKGKKVEFEKRPYGLYVFLARKQKK